jgi:acetyltransferase-like isoleucine patch superfamily enzyme
MNKLQFMFSCFFWVFSKYKILLFQKISTICMVARCWLAGVSLGKNSKFFGRVYLSVHPESEVNIGNACVFRSSFSSNTIGLKQKCFLSTQRNAKIKIGDYCGFSGAVIASQSEVTIGDRVLLGANVTIADSDRHPLDAEDRTKGKGGDAAPIIIENDVWLGMNSVVLKGVRIGEKTIVAANSLVTKDLPPSVVAGGIPAKIIKKL